MSLHISGMIVTAPGVAANNRGENEGNITTLQKILWKGQVHSTVSAEAIRWAIRYYWQNHGIPVNRRWVDEKEDHELADPTWEGWKKDDGETFIDDDVLGYMEAKGGKEEGEKGSAIKRRGVLEVTRSVSLLPYAGDITFNAKSGEKGRTSLYGTEVHATRYQYGFAMTPQRLRVRDRALATLDAIVNLGEVAGNHSRFLFDFSPESIVLRVTDDPAPRILFCFEALENGVPEAPELVRRITAGDIDKEELFLGGPVVESGEVKSLGLPHVYAGVKQAAAACADAIRDRLDRDV